MSAEVAVPPTQDGGLSSSFNRLNVNDVGVGADGERVQRTDEEYAEQQLTLRALVSSKEAGVIIGKSGQNVANLRDQTNVRAGVSKVVPGVPDRVLTVTGRLDGIAKAYQLVARGLLEGAPQMGMGGLINSSGTHRKLLVPSCQLQYYIIFHPGLFHRCNEWRSDNSTSV